jgi:hypothetical protein
MRALTAESLRRLRRPRVSELREYAAAAILMVLFVEVTLAYTGLSTFCSKCAESDIHVPLLVLGIVGWGGWLLLCRRLGEPTTALLVGAMSGAHVGLASFLAAIPRACPTCLTACGLSLIAYFTFLGEGSAWRATLAWTAGVIGTHVILGAL